MCRLRLSENKKISELEAKVSDILFLYNRYLEPMQILKIHTYIYAQLSAL